MRLLHRYRVVGTTGKELVMNAPSGAAATRAAEGIRWLGDVVRADDLDSKRRVPRNARCPCGSGKLAKRCKCRLSRS